MPVEASIEIYLFGTTTDSGDLTQGTRAILFGETSSHLGARITCGEDLYNMYIKGTDLPYEVSTNAQGEKVYMVDINYGPVGDSRLESKGVEFFSYLQACMGSQLLTPVEPSEKAKELVSVDSATIESPIAGPAGELTKQRIGLSPSSIVHFDLIPKEIKNQKYLADKTDAEKLQIIADAVQKAALAIEKIENAYLDDSKSPGAFENYMRDITGTLEELKRELIRDKPDMPMAEFLPILEKFTSLGLAPRQTLKLDFTNSRDGFDVELALKFLRDAKLNERSDSYQLITHNCAVFIRDLLVASTTSHKIKQAFDSNLAEKALGFIGDPRLEPRALSTPVIIMKDAERISKIIDAQQRRQAVEGQTFVSELIKRFDPTATNSHNHTPLLHAFKMHGPRPVHLASVDIRGIKVNFIQLKERMQADQNLKISDKGRDRLEVSNSGQATAVISLSDGQLKMEYLQMPPDKATLQTILQSVYEDVRPGNGEKLVIAIDPKTNNQDAEVIAKQIREAFEPFKNKHDIEITHAGRDISSPQAATNAHNGPDM